MEQTGKIETLHHCKQEADIATIKGQAGANARTLLKIEGLLERIDRTLHGNGSDGLTTRIALTEQSITSIKSSIPDWRIVLKAASIGGGITGAITIGAYLGIKSYFGA